MASVMAQSSSTRRAGGEDGAPASSFMTYPLRMIGVLWLALTPVVRWAHRDRLLPNWNDDAAG